MNMELREGLPPLPARMANLHIDERGYPVPYFVHWVDGKPDHRIADRTKRVTCYRDSRCWLCGEALGSFKAFVIGPMCTITRTSSEPASHRECCEWAVRACPFLTRPKAVRRDANLPDDVQSPPGEGLTRNPGAVAVWVTKHYRAFVVDSGVLFDIGDPNEIGWYAEGRDATRAEVDESIRSGIPLLMDRAPDDADKVALAARIAIVNQMLDQHFKETT